MREKSTDGSTLAHTVLHKPVTQTHKQCFGTKGNTYKKLSHHQSPASCYNTTQKTQYKMVRHRTKEKAALKPELDLPSR